MIQNAARKQTKQGSTEQDLTVALLNDIENNPSTHLGLPEIFKTYHLISHFIDMLLPFCELAFTDLMSAETKLVFNKGQLESKLDKSKVDLAHRLGLISQAKVRSDIGRPQNVSVSFYHKSVQELLAAHVYDMWEPRHSDIVLWLLFDIGEGHGDGKRYDVCGRFRSVIM